jgi:K+-transporting ATPase ATPase C chain
MKESISSTTFASQFRPALAALVLLSAITGVVYPLAVTAVAAIAFPWQANGSLVARDGGRANRGDAVGSALIGQPFTDARYFWSRASATSPAPYDAASSSGSNLGPTNPALFDAVKQRAEKLRASGGGAARPIPVDLVTASASGLDPHISPAAAAWQVSRVATARGVEHSVVEAIVRRHIERRQLEILGEPRVNVLLLNLDLDRSTGAPDSSRDAAGARALR